MGRAAYKITTQDTTAAHDWIQNQLHKNAFWLETDNDGQTDFDRRFAAEKAFKALKWNEAKELHAWCENWLRDEDWRKMKTSIRAARLRKTSESKTVTLSHDAWSALSIYAEDKGLTLSDAILALTKAKKS